MGKVERQTEPEYYYDFSSRKILIIGKTALVGFGKAEAYLSDLHEHGKIDLLKNLPNPLAEPEVREGARPLASLLESTDLPTPKRSGLYDIRHWELRHFKSYGFFLNELVERLNSNTIRSASALGLGASPRQLKRPDLFGSISNFYTTAELKGVKRNTAFHGWTRRDFINYIREVAKELGGRPHIRELNSLARENPKCPSPEVIAPRFGRQHGLGEVMELAGFIDTRSWTEEDYLYWGTKFMRANDGRFPTVSQLDYLCTLQRGPSRHSVRRKFKKISLYQQQIEATYFIEEEIRLRELRRNMQEMEKRLSLPRTLPLLLLRKVETRQSITEEALKSSEQLHYKDIRYEISDREKLVRYAKYKVLEELPILTTSPVVLVKICTVGLPDRTFEGSIKKLNDAITVADVEQTAAYLGVYDYIWPMDEYMIDLRVPVNNRSTKKTEL